MALSLFGIWGKRDVVTSPEPGKAERPAQRIKIEDTWIIEKDVYEKYPVKDITNIDYLRKLLKDYPYDFIELMAHVSPFFSQVVTTTLQLALGNCKFKINVQDENEKYIEDESKEVLSWFNKQPRSVGNFHQLLGKLLCQKMFFSNGIAVESTVIGDGREGLNRLFVIRAHTLRIAYKSGTDIEGVVQWNTLN